MVMMKQFGKIVALCAVVAMAVVLFAQEGKAANHLIWQKQTTGKTAYWKLNSNGLLQDRTEDSGWAWIDSNSIGTAWRQEQIQDNADKQGNDHMVYHNTSNGKVAFWKLNSNGTLQDRTQGSGWEYVNTETISTEWTLVGIMDSNDLPANSGMDRIMWYRASNGKVVYWNLNSNGVLQDRTQDSGWGYVDDTQTLVDWRLANIQTNATP